MIIFPYGCTDMEDAHTEVLSMPGDKDTSYFGVFDGHGGTYISLHINISF